MLVFIINQEQNVLSLRLTEVSVRETLPDYRVIPVHNDIAAVMNREIRNATEPFFITLYAGERITGDFRENLQDWLRRLPEDSGGIILTPMISDSNRDKLSIPRGPVILRKEAIFTGDDQGFATIELLPFEQYVLLEMQARLTPIWRWSEIHTDSWKCRQNQIVKWRRTREEWHALHPVIAAKPSAVGLPENPLFTVVICTYNNAEYLKWAIRSVFNQSYPDWELLIVDDGSQDETARELKDVSGNPRVTILRNEMNRGKSFCLNRALSIVKGSWLVELDADDWFTPDCLAVFADHIEGVSQNGAYYANHYEWLERTDKQMVFQKIKMAESLFSPETLLEQASPLAPRCYHVPALKELGGWWESDPFGGRLYEDFQMLIRLSLKYSVQHVGKVLYHRRLRTGSVTSSNHTCYDLWKSWFQTLIEHPGGLNNEFQHSD